VKNFFTKSIRNYSLAALSIIYLLSRLVNLTKLPIFNDEAIYLDWGWKSLHTSAGLFYSLYDAKLPFLIWIFGTFENILYSPLLVGRLVSVLAGLLTLIGIYKVAKSLENEKVACLASALYIVIPLFAFFDRQALMESSITTAGIWSFYFLLKLLEIKKTKYSIYLGLIIGIGIFIKLQALVFLTSIIVILIYKKLFKPAIVSIIISFIVISPLYFQKMFWASLTSNNRFMLSIPEVLGFPFSLWKNNILATINVSFFHLTPFIFILAIYGMYLFWKGKKGVLPTFFLTNIILVIFLSRSLNPRYLTAFLALIPIFASRAILSFKKLLAFLTGIIAILPPVVITALLVFSPLTYFNFLDKMTAFSQKDSYVTNWTSGYGIPETVNYLNSQSKDKQIIVGVRLDAGNPESAMFTYFNNSKEATPTYLDPQVLDKGLLNLRCLKSPIPVYFVARDGILNGLDKFFQEDKRFGKPEGEHYISIHTLKSCD